MFRVSKSQFLRCFSEYNSQIFEGKTCYQILDINNTATLDQIKKKYFKLSLEHHPDCGGNVDKFKQVNEAYQIIGDETKRKEYDRWLQNQKEGFTNKTYTDPANQDSKWYQDIKDTYTYDPKWNEASEHYKKQNEEKDKQASKDAMFESAVFITLFGILACIVLNFSQVNDYFGKKRFQKGQEEQKQMKKFMEEKINDGTFKIRPQKKKNILSCVRDPIINPEYYKPGMQITKLTYTSAIIRNPLLSINASGRIYGNSFMRAYNERSKEVDKEERLRGFSYIYHGSSILDQLKDCSF